MDGQPRVPKDELPQEEEEGRSVNIPKMEVDEDESGEGSTSVLATGNREESEGGFMAISKMEVDKDGSEERSTNVPATKSREKESDRRSVAVPKREIDEGQPEGPSDNSPIRVSENESGRRPVVVPKMEVDDESEEGEIRNPPPREPTPPRHFRSRESPEAEVSDRGTEVHEFEKESSDAYSHSVFYKGEFVEKDVFKNQKSSKVTGISEICVSAIKNGKNLVFSSDNPETKDEISRFSLEKCAEEKKHTYFVVRNDVVARRRYFDLSEAFPHVSLLSLRKGKVNNKDDFVFVVTIDVIRILLYHGVNFGNNILIFDDCEYLGDPEVGPMYEEALAMLGYAQLILFFPQISNANQIARWICSNFNNDVESVSVRKSEVPVRHFICYYQKGEAVSMKLICDEKGGFNESALEPPPDQPPKAPVNTKKNEMSIFQIQDSIVRLIRTANGLSQTPTLIYCHKTDDVERLANNMGNFNFNPGASKFGALEEDDTKSESKKIIEHFEIFTSMLEEPDRKNPMIETLKNFAFRGIGIYHSGMVPFFRDLTEELFLQGLIKVLFSDRVLISETNLKFKSILVFEPRVTIEPGYSRWMTSREFHSVIERAVGKRNDNPFTLGRILKVRYNELDFGYGIVLQKGTTKLSVAVRVTKESFEVEDPKFLKPSVDGEPETLAVISVFPDENVTRISSFRLRLPMDKKLEDSGVKEFLIWCLKEEEKGLGFPDLDPIEDLKIDDEEISSKWRRLKKLDEKMKTIKKETDDFDQKWKVYQDKLKLESEIQNLEEIKKARFLEDLDEEFQNIKEFLTPVRFFEDGQILNEKGTFAAYLRTTNPVMVADLLFNKNFFNKDLDPKEVVLALSYMVESEVQDGFLKEPQIPILKICKTAVSKYSEFWEEVTKNKETKLGKKFHFTLMTMVQSLFSERFRSFHELYKQLRYTIREGFLATYLKRLDELLLEIYNLKGFLPSEYTDEFWEEFEKLRITKIHRGLATAAIDDIRIQKIDSFK
ncbi:hypothetical protein FO519_004412 [Halicephalobus sp. NKZ332]|nr:hypothetical protein FO519_004412 [Halicephalobus sp. NKZ332]